ncbi:MAG: hypothetical protein M1820_000856 [Bogoriella megaspora]|nr:MAG: hypothetical protein M1820_000856 [Bogoriella megaspora]
MVLKTTLNLARQTFAKTFTHGYAQSVVAASQSSYASQNSQFTGFATNVSNRLQKSPQNPVQHALQSHQGSASSSGLAAQTEQAQVDSGLNAYYQAWHKHNRSEGEKEWQQFQFAKRIGWKPPTTIPEGGRAGQESVAAAEQSFDVTSERGSFERSYTDSAVDDFKRVVGGSEAEAVAIAQVDKAIAQEISKAQEEHQAAAALSGVDEEIISPAVKARSPVDDVSVASPQDVASPVDSTKATSISDIDAFTDHLIKLAKDGQHAQIPAVFEGILAAGVKPSTAAYNALLSAAVHLPKAKHQVVPKVLDVYSDMLRRRVTPDTATYTILLDVLALRALDVFSAKQGLEEKRLRYGGLEEEGRFMFQSNEADLDILAEDDSLTLAMKLFKNSTVSETGRFFDASTYNLLVSACAEQGRVEDMVRVYDHMEINRVIPLAKMFVPMIRAFAKSGDLRSSVECYDEYKALAISNDAGKVSLYRKDEDVYAAVIEAYDICGRPEGGKKFFGRIEAQLSDAGKINNLRDVVGLNAFIPGFLNSESYSAALSFTTDQLSTEVRIKAIEKICVEASDRNIGAVARQAFDTLSKSQADLSRSAMALLAMHVRNGNVEDATPFWSILEQSKATASLLEPTVMYGIALLGTGNAERAMQQARKMFARMRAASGPKTETIDQIDEAIEVIGHFVQKNGIMLPSPASMDLLWAMMENGGLIHPVAEQTLAQIGSEDIVRLPWHDVALLMQMQATIVANDSATLEVSHEARFSFLLDLISGSGVPLNDQTGLLVEQALSRIKQPDLSAKWQHYRFPIQNQVFYPLAYSAQPPPPPTPSHVPPEDYDPYAATTDNKGSQAITDLLDKTHGRHSAHLNEALTKFRNMRRAGRHPRFFTYNKLIAAAARENRLNQAHEILASAQQDIPYLPHNRVVRYGWHGILDSMVAACLTTGLRDQAAQFHRELNEMGAAPSANTFGLYITTLKESAKTFDEASEAVKIFHRAKAEGVEPSSFLYNALIGKLGKARRIDDCLYYFNEMRGLQIRPTSVTYGTVVNALCRVSDEKFAEDLFEEMESMPNYKPRPAPYHSLMQFFLTTKRDRAKVLGYYERMRSKGIQPTAHTYKLLIDTHATLEPVDMAAAEQVLQSMKQSGEMPEAVHYASLIHAKGCVLHDIEGARALFDDVLSDPRIKAQPCLFQALFEAMVANHAVEATEPILGIMRRRGVPMTPYIANALIHGWALKKDIRRAREVFDAVKLSEREPSTYEAMTRAHLAVEEKTGAMEVVREALSRGYPTAVANKIAELVGGGHA